MNLFDDLPDILAGSELLKTILDTVPASISFRDSNNRFVFLNKRAADSYLEMNSGDTGRLDYKPEDFVGKSLKDIFGADTTHTTEEAIAEVIASGEPILNRDIVGPGTIGTYVLNIIPLFDDNQKVLGAVTVAIDVSERRVMERALRDSEAFNLATMANLIDGLVVIDETGTIQAFNQAAQTMFGYPGSEVIGKNVSILMTEADAGAHNGYLADYLQTGVSKILDKGPREVTGHHKDGRAVPLELNIGRIDGAGGPLFVGSLRDISERKRTEEALRRSREEADRAQRRLVEAIENIPEGIALYDSDRRLVLHNKTLQQMFPHLEEIYRQGVLFDDVVRDTVRLGLVVEAVGREEEWAAERIRDFGMKDQAFEQELDGGRWLLLSDHNTEDGGVVSIRTDITELKQREEQLRQAQKMEALGQLTGGVAHDFNNLLAIMMGNIALLEEELGPNSDLKALTEPTLRAIDQASELTQRMLSFARQQPLKIQDVDPNTFLTNIQPLIQQALNEDIKVEFSTLVGIWHCKVDLAQLEQAIVNLAINAREAMPDGGRLRIELGNAALPDPSGQGPSGLAPGEYITIAMADTGRGVPAADLPRIFDPFFTTKEVGEGSGLGLSMVHGFVKQSRGDITVQSEVGGGTTFRLYLPRAEIEPDSRPEAQPVKAAPKATGETILVIEDEADVQTMVARSLRRAGYEVILADAGQAGLDILAQRGGGVDLLLTDVLLPGGKNGQQVADEAQANDPNLKVLFMSGYSRDAIVDQGRIRPDVRLLTKPFVPAELSRRVREVLDEE
ncbi:MAG: PAS domain S-box protein [Alphaproteobacteria bacterium]|jgi:PAS domain S-box-containing protein|nr:PAS domain S-box protein [Alphaproteobacteria bacterium]